MPGCPRRHFPHGAAAISPAHPRRTGPAGGVTGAGIRGAEPAVPPAGSLLAAANLPRRTRRLRRGDGNGVGEGGTGTDRLAKRPQAGKGPPRRCRGTGQTHTHTATGGSCLCRFGCEGGPVGGRVPEAGKRAAGVYRPPPPASAAPSGQVNPCGLQAPSRQAGLESCQLLLRPPCYFLKAGTKK